MILCNVINCANVCMCNVMGHICIATPLLHRVQEQNNMLNAFIKLLVLCLTIAFKSQNRRKYCKTFVRYGNVTSQTTYTDRIQHRKRNHHFSRRFIYFHGKVFYKMQAPISYAVYLVTWKNQISQSHCKIYINNKCILNPARNMKILKHLLSNYS